MLRGWRSDPFWTHKDKIYDEVYSILHSHSIIKWTFICSILHTLLTLFAFTILNPTLCFHVFSLPCNMYVGLMCQTVHVFKCVSVRPQEWCAYETTLKLMEHSALSQYAGPECETEFRPLAHTEMFPLESPVMASPFSAKATHSTYLGFSCFWEGKDWDNWHTIIRKPYRANLNVSSLQCKWHHTKAL